MSFGAFGIVGLFYRILEIYGLARNLITFCSRCGYLDEGLKNEISNTGILGFGLIA